MSYGKKPERTANWRQQMASEVSLDEKRTHFVGKLPYAQYVKVLQVSSAHMYLSYPFVLSWSLLEASACGSPIVASNTAPVREVIGNGVNGRLVEFFDVEGMTNVVNELLNHAGEYSSMRSEARRLAQKFSKSAGVSGYDALLKVQAASREKSAIAITS